MKPLRCTIVLALFVLIVWGAWVPVRAQSSGSLTKTPYEQIDITFDFSAFPAAVANGITLDTVQAVNALSKVDSTPTIIVEAPSSPVPAVVPGTQLVQLRLQNGSVGETYNIAIRVLINSIGGKLEGDVTLHIAAGNK